MKMHGPRNDSVLAAPRDVDELARGRLGFAPREIREAWTRLLRPLSLVLGLFLVSAIGCVGAEPPTEVAPYDPGIPVAPPSERPRPEPVAATPSTPVAPIPSASAPASTPAGESAAAVGGTTNAVAATETRPLAMDALDDKHRLAVGDRVSFRIVEDEEEPKSLVVADSGEIEVPYIGRFWAAEKTCKELAKALKAELEKEYYYQATVLIGLDLMARSRGKVYLVGPVRAPGPQEIPSDEVLTLSKAILRAGGFLDTADRKNVRVTRKKVPGPGEDISTVNLVDILEKGRTEGDMVLQTGDLIYIPERLIRF